MNGAIIIDKPEGITSQTAVNAVRKFFGTKRVGHTGTLDPMATGVLVVLVGNAVKASELLVCDEKKYDAVIKFGIATDTQDITGKVISEFSGKLPTLETLNAVIPKFTGEIVQIPPMYSALKVGGEKLCDLARKGIEVERQERKINIYSLSAEKSDGDGEFVLHIHCSKGTYIRTLCEDIGKALGCPAAMAKLRRTESGGFSLDDAVTLDFLKGENKPESLLIPTEKLFPDAAKVVLSPFYSKLARCGNEIYIKKIGLCAECGERFLIYDSENVFFSLSECTEFPGGLALKSVKMFV